MATDDKSEHQFERVFTTLLHFPPDGLKTAQDSEVKESPRRTSFTERVYIDCFDSMKAGSNCPGTLPVASFSQATPRKTYWYQDFFSFFLFSMFLK